jgi:hypothetical protein
MLTAIPLLTLPQFIMLQYVKGKADSWHTLSGYDKYNALAWELISHLWFLLVRGVNDPEHVGVYPDETQIDAKRRRQRACGVNDEVNADFCSAGFRLCRRQKNDFHPLPFDSQRWHV